jgi:hypothetical protein
MSSHILKGYKFFFGPYDISSLVERPRFDWRTAVVDNTGMSAETYRSFLSGLEEGRFDLEAYWSEGSTELSGVLENPNLNYDGNPVTLYPNIEPGTFGGISAQITRAIPIRSEKIGDIARLRFMAQLYSPAIRTTPIYPLTTRTATGTFDTTPLNLGSVASGKKLYGFLHVTDVSGGLTSAVISFQSSSSEGGSYSTKLIFSTVSGTYAEMKTIDGPITDTWWRQRCSIYGTPPLSITFTSAWGVK